MYELPLVLTFLLVLAILLRMDIVFYLVYVLAGVYGLTRWWTAHNLKRLQVERNFTEHMFAGETATVEIRIRNRSILPAPWLRYDESAPVSLESGNRLMHALTLGPKEQVTLRYELAARQRGLYKIGPGRLTTGDLFGFADATGTFEEQRHLIVYPRVIPLMHTPLTSRAPYGTVASTQPIFADPARVNGVRPYQRGDPVRIINWKTSARSAQLQVKKTEPAVSLATAIYLDLHIPTYAKQLRFHATEWAVVLAASLAAYLIEQRQEVGMGSNGRDELTGSVCWRIPPRSGRNHLMKLLEWLARVQASEARPLADWLSQGTIDLAWGTTVVAITPSGDEAMSGVLHRLRQAGLNPVLIAVEPHAHFAVVQERCRRLGIAAFQVANEGELRRWQTRYAGAISRAGPS